MGELTAIGFSPGRSLFHRLDPRTKQALLAGMAAVSIWGSPLFLGVLSVVVLYGFHAARVRFSRLGREIRYFLVFLLCIFGVRTLSWGDGWIPVASAERVAAAVMICWQLLVVVLMGLLLMATTRTTHIRAALAWYLKPIPLIDEKMAATMVGLVVTFLPRILYQAAEIADAQRARCIDRRKHPLYRLRCFSIPLFRRVFAGADELVAAMQSRCYNENRTPPDLAFTRQDLAVVVVAILVCLTLGLP